MSCQEKFSGAFLPVSHLKSVQNRNRVLTRHLCRRNRPRPGTMKRKSLSQFGIFVTARTAARDKRREHKLCTICVLSCQGTMAALVHGTMNKRSISIIIIPASVKQRIRDFGINDARLPACSRIDPTFHRSTASAFRNNMEMQT
jgi:hypothetical protein